MMAARLEAVWDDHCSQEFVHKDVVAAIGTMTKTASVNHVPVMTGATGIEQVERFYRDHFVGQSPADFSLEPVNRTVGEKTLVDEFICSFTHDIVMDWMMPGISPTGRRVRLPVIAVVGFEDDLIASEPVYWDQASLLVQIGLLNPQGLPVIGAEAADRVTDASVAANALIAAR